ncbi:MAG: hypothetical protein AAFX76_14780, partial [Planctomycetota bacterium]
AKSKGSALFGCRALCHRLRDRGILVRPLGDVIVLMPIPATPHDVLTELVDRVVEAILEPRPTV